ncbi:MAG: hypothetical protein NC299_03855 [Lachnospiraceae bacterium]|nr:hypothetical protein [Ruminococcus sp.]MCM1274481.1 hypothetical protein [Lachnospiraceae bacterium]
MKKIYTKLLLGGLGANIAAALFLALMFALAGGSYSFGIIIMLAFGVFISQIRADMRDGHGMRAGTFFLLWNAPSCAIAAVFFVLATAGWTLTIEDFAAALAVVLPMLALMFIAPTMLLSELLWLGVAALRKRRSR